MKVSPTQKVAEKNKPKQETELKQKLKCQK